MLTWTMAEDLSLHDVDDLVRLSVAFKNLAGVATDPDGVELRVRDPSGNVETRTWPPDGLIVNDVGAVGAFRSDVNVDESGDWWFRWKGTGAVQEVEEARFRVRARVVA
jgi:hypothetical protein